MRRPSAALVLLLLLPGPLRAEAPPVPAAAAGPRAALHAAVADLAWIAGRWTSVEEGVFSEETWAPPSGDSMVGMWRLAVGGRVKVFELLTLVEEDGKVVLRLRHFDPRSVAREEKESPLALPLVEKRKDVAVFEGLEGGGLLRLTYRREGKRLTVSLEKGAEPAQLYRFERAGP